MIENVSTQLTVFHCLCPLPASRKGLRLPLRSALFGEGGSDWRPCILIPLLHVSNLLQNGHFPNFSLLSAFFVTIATVRVESIQDLYTLTTVLIN